MDELSNVFSFGCVLSLKLTKLEKMSGRPRSCVTELQINIIKVRPYFSMSGKYFPCHLSEYWTIVILTLLLIIVTVLKRVSGEVLVFTSVTATVRKPELGHRGSPSLWPDRADSFRICLDIDVIMNKLETSKDAL